jgi:hypothetical protein
MPGCGGARVSPATGNLSVFNGEGMEIALIMVRPPLLWLVDRANQFGRSPALPENRSRFLGARSDDIDSVFSVRPKLRIYSGKSVTRFFGPGAMRMHDAEFRRG